LRMSRIRSEGDALAATASRICIVKVVAAYRASCPIIAPAAGLLGTGRHLLLKTNGFGLAR
jgi:hypothetical protein